MVAIPHHEITPPRSAHRLAADQALFVFSMPPPRICTSIDLICTSISSFGSMHQSCPYSSSVSHHYFFSLSSSLFHHFVPIRAPIVRLWRFVSKVPASPHVLARSYTESTSAHRRKSALRNSKQKPHTHTHSKQSSGNPGNRRKKKKNFKSNQTQQICWEIVKLVPLLWCP